jgi:ABC-2 type transport system permease protein
MYKGLYQFEFALFCRSKAAWFGMLILLMSGVCSLYLGKTFISRQQQMIEKAAAIQEEHTSRNIQYFGKELGTLLYHNKYTIANKPDNWSAFSNGQRDINPYLISVSMLGLQGQMYDTDLNNPVTLLYGNIDLAFVFIFLFPLVIIAFTYNLLSAEQEAGVWRLLSAQTGQPLRILLRRLVVRIVAVFAVALMLIAFAFFYLHLSADLRLLYVVAIVTAYLLFWFALSFWVISLGKSSDFNIASLIACWVALNIMLPAFVNVMAGWKYPVPEALQTVVQQREGYHEKWDMDKKVTMDKFFAHYPQFRKYPFSEDEAFSWFWYYAMQQMGDDEAATGVAAMSAKLRQRQQFTNTAALMLPGIQATLRLNEVAGADMQHHLDFLQTLKDYHEKIRLYFYPILFNGGTTQQADWHKFRMAYFSGYTTGKIGQQLSTVLFILLLTFFAVRNFRKMLSKVS